MSMTTHRVSEKRRETWLLAGLIAASLACGVVFGYAFFSSGEGGRSEGFVTQIFPYAKGLGLSLLMIGIGGGAGIAVRLIASLLRGKDLNERREDVIGLVFCVIAIPTGVALFYITR
ncbi:hypothetical protein [Methylibium rhizosphaerae]|uniref:hypothetical protein n=1 Tax=Methylibium rhizosphaerae TaxID=2570323 RepID=UPI001129F216|nr:hypothetical protein [Methylibium rhizosphaerae]